MTTGISMQGSLFESGPAFPKAALAEAVNALRKQNIFLGTSSWRYEGWLGQIYTPERYFSRGRFSKKKFHEECIEEYADVFPVVGGDFSYYAIPSPAFWATLFGCAPEHLKWTLKVPEDFTRKHFPRHERYGARRGHVNPAFLDAGMFEAGFLEPLAPYFNRIAVLVFEFGSFSNSDYADPQTFFDDLENFLKDIPTSVRYSIELRNADFLHARYFDILRSAGVAHTFNSWTRMPSLRDQLAVNEAMTVHHTVLRALLRPGRAYEQAVKMFSPYAEIKDPYPEGRQAMRDLIRKSMADKRTAFIHANNRFEGNAIETLKAVVDDLAEPS